MMKTLIVDYIRPNRELLSFQLKAEGYDVIECGDGFEALQALSKYEIGLVISDIHMPNMDGFQLCRTLRDHIVYKDIPFIFYSATYTSSDDKRFTTDLGGDVFIKKPSPIEIVTAAMEDLLNYPGSSLRSKATAKMNDAELVRAHNASVVERFERKSTVEVRTLHEHESPQAAVIHDLNNILGIIIGCVDTLSTAKVSPAKTKGYLDSINEAAFRAAGLLNQLRMISKDKVPGLATQLDADRG